MSDNQTYVASLEASIAKLLAALKPFADLPFYEMPQSEKAGHYLIANDLIVAARQAIEDQEGCGA